jgi:surface protein
MAYINDGRPIYITYARNDKNHSGWDNIENVVNIILDKFRKESIQYSVDTEDIEAGNEISNFEREIGRSKYTIIFYSEKYFQSSHCMYEFAEIRKTVNNGDKKEYIYINADGVVISDDYIRNLKKIWMQRENEIEQQQQQRCLTSIEKAAQQNNYYKDDIAALKAFFSEKKRIDANNLNVDALMKPIYKWFNFAPYAILCKNGTLKFYYNGDKPFDAYKMRKGEMDEWGRVAKKIKQVVFDESFKRYNPKSCEYWFCGCKNLITITGMKEYLNTSEVESMECMFWRCERLVNLDVSGFDTANVSSMKDMFHNCAKLTKLDVKNFNTNNVTSMEGMFCGCKKLKSIDVGSFDTVNVVSMQAMFQDCEKLETLDISHFNTTRTETMEQMFFKCLKLKTLDITGFEIHNGVNLVYMFNQCSNLKSIYAGEGWNSNNIKHSEWMFGGCEELVGGNGTQCNAKLKNCTLYARIDGGQSAPGYFTQK